MKNKIAKLVIAAVMLVIALTVAPQRAAAQNQLCNSYCQTTYPDCLAAACTRRRHIWAFGAPVSMTTPTYAIS
jgi:hypothetical protein